MKSTTQQQMIVNVVPGDECRIALLEDGRLEEFYAERENQELHVGNIYLARVVNVEAAIQAAFVDFGLGRNGFLHISDVHPKYFQGQDHEDTETVGHKTPHRARPPIQHCLKRGQDILVQVVKEGIGTKGPTLTSYLSLPGRYLVMMPDMERSGVSRRVEDFDQRREMKQILDSLDLPDGFGFILRTAGLDRSKTELKRDLAYLHRLWKSIESKRAASKAPAELFAESDLLMRTVRDVLSNSVERIIIDDPGALRRVTEFMNIVAPRSRTTGIVLYDQPIPIFHAFGIEEQLQQSRERVVPLPSGGSLVIDSTEAMVAIDVNSGKMRQYRDAETTAFKTDLEAVDEIARQLRLRDLGGLIVLDLIDMRFPTHQRDVENRFRDNIKRDRAKTEFLRISRFGLIEMTRQRMRPSHDRASMVPCPSCAGRGNIRSPEATAAEAIRDMANLLSLPDVDRLEMVVANSVASVLLSRVRRRIGDVEDRVGKHVEIRVSQTIASDRIDFYAYDARNVDLDLPTLLKRARRPISEIPVKELEDLPAPLDADDLDSSLESDESLALPVDSTSTDAVAASADGAVAPHVDGQHRGDAEPDDRGRRRSRRGGRGRGRRGGRGRGVAPDSGQSAPPPHAAPAPSSRRPVSHPSLDESAARAPALAPTPHWDDLAPYDAIPVDGLASSDMSSENLDSSADPSTADAASSDSVASHAGAHSSDHPDNLSPDGQAGRRRRRRRRGRRGGGGGGSASGPADHRQVRPIHDSPYALADSASDAPTTPADNRSRLHDNQAADRASAPVLPNTGPHRGKPVSGDGNAVSDGRDESGGSGGGSGGGRPRRRRRGGGGGGGGRSSNANTSGARQSGAPSTSGPSSPRGGGKPATPQRSATQRPAPNQSTLSSRFKTAPPVLRRQPAPIPKTSPAPPASPSTTPTPPAPKSRRRLYGSRRRLSPGAAPKLSGADGGDDE